MLGEDIDPAATSSSSPPLLQVLNVSHRLPTTPPFASQHHRPVPSQPDRAHRLLVNECGFGPGLSQAPVFSSASSCPQVPTASYEPPSEQTSPAKWVPVFKKRRPSRQDSLALQPVSQQTELQPGTSQETGSWTSPPLRTRALPAAASSTPRSSTMAFPAHNLLRAQPRQPRLWVPPAAKFRCDPKSTLKQSCERVETSKHQAASDSSSQVSASQRRHGRRSVITGAKVISI